MKLLHCGLWGYSSSEIKRWWPPYSENQGQDAPGGQVRWREAWVSLIFHLLWNWERCQLSAAAENSFCADGGVCVFVKRPDADLPKPSQGAVFRMTIAEGGEKETRTLLGNDAKPAIMTCVPAVGGWCRCLCGKIKAKTLGTKSRQFSGWISFRLVRSEIRAPTDPLVLANGALSGWAAGRIAHVPLSGVCYANLDLVRSEIRSPTP